MTCIDTVIGQQKALHIIINCTVDTFKERMCQRGKINANMQNTWIWLKRKKRQKKCRLTAEILLREIHRAKYFHVLHTSVLPDQMTGHYLSSCVRLVVSHTHKTLKRPACSHFCLSLGMKPAGNKSVPVPNPVAGVVVINTDLKGPGGAFPKSSLAMGCRVGGFKTVYFHLGDRMELMII